MARSPSSRKRNSVWNRPTPSIVEHARALGVLGGTDVGQQVHRVAVAGRAGPASRSERAFSALAALDQVGSGGRIRIDEHLTGGAVDSQDGPDTDGDRARQLHDRRNAHLRGQDRGVAGGTARLGNDGQHQVASQVGALRRGKVVGHDHARRGELWNARVLEPEQPGHGSVPHVA
jgi:hypothetical protein